jgi:Ferritin-like
MGAMAAAPDWTLDDLREHLQAAVELELLVIPPYLCALYSLMPATNLEAALVIRSVVVEEMLHMILAANVLNAVGGRPVVGGGWAPRYPAKIPYHKGHFAVHLRPYDDRALDAFLAIENPSYLPQKAAKPPRDAGVPRLVTLGTVRYATIGAFYAAIRDALHGLVGRLGHDAVFTGHRGRQVGPEHYYASGGRAREVHDLTTADAAIDEIVEQGEGEVTLPPPGEKFDPQRDLAHYYRFNELRLGRRYRPSDEPAKPTGEPIRFDRGSVYPMKPNLRARDVADPALRRAVDDCNEVWSRLLRQLEVALTGSPGELEKAVGTMLELKYRAVDLMRIPLPNGRGKNAGPTFEYLSAAPS